MHSLESCPPALWHEDWESAYQLLARIPQITSMKWMIATVPTSSQSHPIAFVPVIVLRPAEAPYHSMLETSGVFIVTDSTGAARSPIIPALLKIDDPVAVARVLSSTLGIAKPRPIAVAAWRRHHDRHKVIAEWLQRAAADSIKQTIGTAE